MGIVLSVKDPVLKYCYGTRSFKKLYGNADFVKIPAKKMEQYFKDAQDTYIYISDKHIHEIYLITFTNRLQNSEYNSLGMIDKDIFITIISMVKNSDNLSDRFKKDFFDLIEPEM